MPTKAKLDFDRAVGLRLRQAREAIGYASAIAYAQAAGLKQSTYSNWENGRGMSLQFAIALCRAHRLTLDWIYRGEVDAHLPPKVARKLRPRKRKSST